MNIKNGDQNSLKALVIAAVGLGVYCWSIASMAANSAPWVASVTDLITDSSAFGGCMAKVNPPPSDQGGVTCSTDWVTFSCDGTYNSKSQGANKMAAAQLAYVTGGQVKLVVQDQYQHNSHCFARRIDNVAP